MASVVALAPVFRLPSFTARAAGDSDVFYLDCSAQLAPGETLSGVPAVSVTTGDLTVTGISLSGTVLAVGLSGAGTPGAYSLIAVSVTTNLRGPFTRTAQVLTLPNV
jgi:hypothetical protein